MSTRKPSARSSRTICFWLPSTLAARLNPIRNPFTLIRPLYIPSHTPSSGGGLPCLGGVADLGVFLQPRCALCGAADVGGVARLVRLDGCFSFFLGCRCNLFDTRRKQTAHLLPSGYHTRAGCYVSVVSVITSAFLCHSKTPFSSCSVFSNRPRFSASQLHFDGNSASLDNQLNAAYVSGRGARSPSAWAMSSFTVIVSPWALPGSIASCNNWRGVLYAVSDKSWATCKCSHERPPFTKSDNTSGEKPFTACNLRRSVCGLHLAACANSRSAAVFAPCGTSSWTSRHTKMFSMSALMETRARRRIGSKNSLSKYTT